MRNLRITKCHPNEGHGPRQKKWREKQPLVAKRTLETKRSVHERNPRRFAALRKQPRKGFPSAKRYGRPGIDDLGRGVDPEREKRVAARSAGETASIRQSAEPVTGAVNTAAANAAAGKNRRIAKRPMIAAGGVVDLGRAAEFAERDDQCRIEQAAIGQIVDQRRKPAIRREE